METKTPAAPVTDNKKLLLILGGGCLVLVVCCVISLIAISALGTGFITQVSRELEGDVKVIDDSEKPTDGGTSAPSEGSVEKPFPFGNQVKVEDVVWQVSSAKDHGKTVKATEQYYSDCKADSGKFVSVTFTVKNDGTDSVTLYDIKVADNKGREYSISSDIYTCVSNYTIFETLNPGIQKELTAYFEVPDDAAGISLVASDLSFFGETVRYLATGL